MASKLGIDEIYPVSGTDVSVSGNVNVGTDAVPKTLDVSENVVINKVDGIVVTAGRVEAPAVGASGDSAITGSFTLSSGKQACADGGTVVMRDSSGAGTLTQAGFVKAYLDDGTEIYIPYFTAHAGA